MLRDDIHELKLRVAGADPGQRESVEINRRSLKRLIAANEAMEKALTLIMAYPSIRQHLGSDICDVVDVALRKLEE